MRSQLNNYPVRAFIRHKARLKLTQILTGETDIDNTLLQDISSTLLQPDISPTAYQPYASRDQAIAIEEQMATEIAETYCRMQRQLKNPLVQQLNQLL